MKKVSDLSSDKTINNIWRYSDLYKDRIEPAFRLTLNEGWTENILLESFAKQNGMDHVWIKRDDLNPSGSHKARSLAYQISKYHQNGKKDLLISSSGNAAVAGAAYAEIAGIRFFAFISPDTEKYKVELLKKHNAHIIITSKPINIAKYISRIYNIVNLRPSTNDSSLEGYKSIAFELTEQNVFPDAIFLCPTSASTLIGIAHAYNYLKEEYGIAAPQMHAVQYGEINSIALRFSDKTNIDTGIENPRLGVRHTQRENEAVDYIQKSGGSGWLVDSNDINHATELLRSYGIKTSIEGNASFAGLLKAMKLHNLKNPLCLLTGKYIDNDEPLISHKDRVYRINSYIEAKNLFNELMKK